MSAIFRAALEYAERGWPVVPLKGKVPWLKDWVAQASTDPKVIRGWWQTRGDSNVGLVTGPRSGFWVLDVDAGRDGLNTLARLEEEHGVIQTRRAVTGSGGQHLFFRLPVGVDLGNRVDALPGIDVRATGGQVVAAPSIHPTTGVAYEWEADVAGIEVTPVWLLELLCPPAPPKRPYVPPTAIETSDRERSFVSRALTGACGDIASAGEGARHKTLHDKAVKLGGYIAADLIDEVLVVTELQRAGEASGKDGKEVARTVGDGVRAGKLRPLRPDLSASTSTGPSTPAPTKIEAMAWWDANPEASSSEAAQVLGIKAATLRGWQAERTPTSTSALNAEPPPASTAPPGEAEPPESDDPLVQLAQVLARCEAGTVKAQRSAPLYELLGDAAWIEAMVAARMVSSLAGAADLARLGDVFHGAKAVVAQLEAAIKERRAAIVEAARAAVKPPVPPIDEDTPPGGGDGNEKPEILISTNMARVLDLATRSLNAAGDLYQRGATLVHLTRDQSPTGLTWDPDAPALRIVRPARLRVAMATAARWTKVAEGLKEPALPPTWAVEALLAQDEWPFRRAQGISEIPILRPNGDLHDVPGHDPVTGYIYEPRAGFKLNNLGEPLSQDLARRAYLRLCDVFADFPFADPWHKAAAVSCLLSLVARPAIDGPVPMFPVLSTTPKSGKSMMVETIHLLATGREIARMAPGATEEEIEKRITTIAMSALPAVLLDNLTGTFGGPSIDAAVQARVWQGRILGKTEAISVPIRTVWTLTGNNLAIKGDLAQRVIPIQLAPDIEKPELRTDFLIPDLRAWVRDPANRADILTAAFALLRSHAAAGRPVTGTFGGYREWNEVIRSALVWAGAPDPYQGVDQLADVADERLGQMRALLEVWYDSFASSNVYLADLQTHYVADRFPALFATIKSMAATKDGLPDMIRLGNLLRVAAGRLYGGHKVGRSDERRHGARAWKVFRPGRPEQDAPVNGTQETIPY